MAPVNRTSLNPLTWLRRIEDGIFGLAAEAEYRLGLAPRTVKIVHSDFDRRMMRLFLVAMPMLIGSLFIDDRQFRTRLMVSAIAVAVSTVTVMVMLNARSPKDSGRGRPLRPQTPRQPDPPATQAQRTRRP